MDFFKDFIYLIIISSTLYFFSSIPARDASNGFRLFSRKLLNTAIANKYGWYTKINLNEGANITIEDYIKKNNI